MIKKPIDIPRAWGLVLIVAITLGATFIRVYDSANTPPGLTFDTTWDLADALRISRGIPFPADFDTRPEPAYRWMLAASFVLLGPHVYSTLVFQVLVSALTVALTYEAALVLLSGHSWRRLGALIAAGTIAANAAHLFLVRSPYRSILLPPILLIAVILFLKASRSQQNRTWALSGFVSSLGMHVYIAGLLTPVWAAGFAIHHVMFGSGKWRQRIQHVLWLTLGMLPLLLVWFALVRLMPDLYIRVQAAGGAIPITPLRVLNGFVGAIKEFYLVGYSLPIYNTPTTPYLNPLLAILALIGFSVALWRWRTAQGAILLGGMVLFILPGALSEDPTHPVRLVGTMPLLALLVGWGSAALVTVPSTLFHLRIDLRPALTVAASALIVVSIGATHLAYRAMFANPDEYSPPVNWLGIPHNYTMALTEALELLEKVDQPTYVPLSVLDTPAAGYVIQREAFPNVTTWARYGLSELPAGQYFFPIYTYYHVPTPTDDPRMALLLPAEKTIVILPDAPDGPIVREPVSPQTRTIKNARGWTIARISSVERAPLIKPELTTVDSSPTAGVGLQLAGEVTPLTPKSGQKTPVLVYWRVTAPQPTDIFSVAQLLNLNLIQYGNSDHHVLPYLYPSARWQPGDVIPDYHLLTIYGFPDGIYRWAVGVYVPPVMKRLIFQPQDSGLDDTWLWGAVRAPVPKSGQLPADVTLLNAHFDDHINLLGYRLARDQATWTLSLYWRTDGSNPPQGDYIVFVHAMTGDKMIAQQDAKPFDGQLPTWAWKPGEIVTTTYTLNIPAGSPAPQALYAGMYPYPSLVRLPVTQDGKLTPDQQVIIWTSNSLQKI